LDGGVITSACVDDTHGELDGTRKRTKGKKALLAETGRERGQKERTGRAEG
jgi:hypothetical protein